MAKKKVYSEACDIWSLGCIIFNMNTGIPPFFDYDFSIMKNLVASQYTGYYPQFDKGASEILISVVSRCLVVDPEERMDADDLVADPWINSAH